MLRSPGAPRRSPLPSLRPAPRAGSHPRCQRPGATGADGPGLGPASRVLNKVFAAACSFAGSCGGRTAQLAAIPEGLRGGAGGGPPPRQELHLPEGCGSGGADRSVPLSRWAAPAAGRGGACAVPLPLPAAAATGNSAGGCVCVSGSRVLAPSPQGEARSPSAVGLCPTAAARGRGPSPRRARCRPPGQCRAAAGTEECRRSWLPGGWAVLSPSPPRPCPAEERGAPRERRLGSPCGRGGDLTPAGCSVCGGTLFCRGGTRERGNGTAESGLCACVP